MLIVLYCSFVVKYLMFSNVFVFQSLLRSPEVISFLQQQQQLLATQSRSQSQQQFQSC